MWLVLINKHIIESITDYNFVNTYWYIHIFLWMLLECVGRLYIINALVKPHDKPSNINNVDLQNVKLFFSFDIEHIKLFETIQLHVLNTFKNVNKNIFIFCDVIICTNCSLKYSYLIQIWTHCPCIFILSFESDSYKS